MTKCNLLIICIILIGCGVNSLQNNYQQEINHPSDLLEHVVKRLMEIKGINSVERTDTSYKTIGRTIRSSPSRIWIDGSITACVRPNTSIASFCNMDNEYKVPKYLLKILARNLEYLVRNFELLRPTLHTYCFAAIKDLVCKGALPKCSQDETVATYLNFNSSCVRLNATCPANYIHINGQNAKSLCLESGQNYQLNGCLRPTQTAINKQYCSPFTSQVTYPSWLMTSISVQNKTVSDIKLHYPSRNVSSSCIDQWVQITCNRIPFCSPDRKHLYVGVNKQQCQAAMACLPPGIAATKALAVDCNNFPDRNSTSFINGDHRISIIKSFNLFFICLLSLMLIWN